MEVSLRERKKAETRRALHKAVLSLAVARGGLDAVTLDAIADEANVSRRTFSNYFANKEDAVLYGEQVRAERMLSELRDRPATEGAWLALRAAARRLVADLDAVDPEWLTQVRLVRQHPSLLAQQAAAHATLERGMADEIAKRTPGADAMRARVLAASFLAALRTVIIVWSEQPEGQTLAQALEDGLDVVGSAFA